MDEIVGHSFDSQSGGQDKRRGSVRHFGVKIRGAISQQNLEDALSVRGDGGVERSAAGVVGGIGIGTSVEEAFGSVCASETSGEMEGSFAGTI